MGVTYCRSVLQQSIALLNIAAFTGTNGKTTRSQLYAQLLASVSMVVMRLSLLILALPVMLWLIPSQTIMSIRRLQKSVVATSSAHRMQCRRSVFLQTG